jgi:hypothetical protein
MRLDVYTPSGTQSGAETNDVKRSGGVAQSRAARTQVSHETPAGPWLKERPLVSPMGQLMRELHAIKSDNPQAFAQITGAISQELQAMAFEDTAEGPERLMAMAERFERASARGDLSPFRAEPQSYGGVLRGPWAYRQNDELHEARADVQAVIGHVLDAYAQAKSSPTENVTGSNASTRTEDQ